jgi:hypothetical protein
MQTGQFGSAPDAVRLILKNEGAKGLFAVLVFPHYEGPSSVIVTQMMKDFGFQNYLFCNLA